MLDRPNSQKAKLIARLQTYVPLYEWPLLDELAESGGPSDRDAVLEEAATVAEDLETGYDSKGSGYRGEYTASDAAKAIRALKNAAPQSAGADDVLWKIRVELAALVANPDKPDWMPALTNGNPADAECLSRAYALTKSNATDSEG